MRETISLLKEISYMHGYALREQSLPEPSRGQVCELLGSLWHGGLLRVVDSAGDDLLGFRYALSRPLGEITLYDVLLVTGGYLCFPKNAPVDFSVQYGPAGQRLNVLESMAYRFLSEIPVVEVVFPDKWQNIKEEAE
jgi:hypothetical protein